MGQNKRNLPGGTVYDSHTIHTMEFNPAAGGQKVLEVGRCLIPLGNGNASYTTDATTARILPNFGRNIAVYNNANTVGAVTVSADSGVTALTPGQVNTTAGAGFGDVGVPCKPNDWTYIACGEKNYVIASANTLLVFLIEDPTSIKQEFNILPGN